MTSSMIDQSQRKAARVVGFTYLCAMAVAVFAEFYVRGHLVVANNAVDTARNIMAHERLFRVGIASNLFVSAIDLALIAALYVVLEPVGRNLALFAVFLRLVETSVGAAMTLYDFDVLRLLSGADYVRVFETDRLQTLARLSLGAHGAGNSVAFVFLGLGSAVFGYLWFRSNYIPRALAALGVFGSLLLTLLDWQQGTQAHYLSQLGSLSHLLAFLLLAAGPFTFIIYPSLTAIFSPWYMAPIGVFEVTMGFWLLFKGLPSDASPGS